MNYIGEKDLGHAPWEFGYERKSVESRVNKQIVRFLQCRRRESQCWEVVQQRGLCRTRGKQREIIAKTSQGCACKFTQLSQSGTR